MFDPSFYRFQNPELSSLDDSSLEEHFNETGWKEGLDPSAFFNVSAYLDWNPDVADAGLNPLVHFVTTGKLEGRIAVLSGWGGKTLDALEHVSSPT